MEAITSRIVLTVWWSCLWPIIGSTFLEDLRALVPVRRTLRLNKRLAKLVVSSVDGDSSSLSPSSSYSSSSSSDDAAHNASSSLRSSLSWWNSGNVTAAERRQMNDFEAVLEQGLEMLKDGNTIDRVLAFAVAFVVVFYEKKAVDRMNVRNARRKRILMNEFNNTGANLTFWVRYYANEKRAIKDESVVYNFYRHSVGALLTEQRFLSYSNNRKKSYADEMKYICEEGLPNFVNGARVRSEQGEEALNRDYACVDVKFAAKEVETARVWTAACKLQSLNVTDKEPIALTILKLVEPPFGYILGVELRGDEQLVPVDYFELSSDSASPMPKVSVKVIPHVAPMR